MSVEIIKTEYGRLTEEIEFLITGCASPEQAMWEMIRQAARLAVLFEIPKHKIVTQLRDEYDIGKIDLTGHDGLN